MTSVSSHSRIATGVANEPRQQPDQRVIVTALETPDTTNIYKNCDSRLDDLGELVEAAGIKVSTSIKKAVLDSPSGEKP